MVDGNYVRMGSACHCGEPVRLLVGRGRPPKVCEAHAEKPKPKRVQKELPQKECPVCRGFFTSKKDGTYCSRACWLIAASKPLCECILCGVKFKSSKSSLGLYCSKTCWGATRTARKNPNHSKCVDTKIFPCRVCGTLSKNMQCSRACELAYARAKNVSVAEAAHRQDARVNECIECKALYCPLYGHSSATLCVPCADGRSRASKAARRALRKVMELAAKVEAVDPYKVFDRDGWQCKICGVSTPPSKRGTYEDDAPELDHIRPLSKRGEHSYRNTQCACRKCNGAKSNEWESGGFEVSLSIG